MLKRFVFALAIMSIIRFACSRMGHVLGKKAQTIIIASSAHRDSLNDRLSPLYAVCALKQLPSTSPSYGHLGMHPKEGRESTAWGTQTIWISTRSLSFVPRCDGWAALSQQCL